MEWPQLEKLVEEWGDASGPPPSSSPGEIVIRLPSSSQPSLFPVVARGRARTRRRATRAIDFRTEPYLQSEAFDVDTQASCPFSCKSGRCRLLAWRNQDQTHAWSDYVRFGHVSPSGIDLVEITPRRGDEMRAMRYLYLPSGEIARYLTMDEVIRAVQMAPIPATWYRTRVRIVLR